MEIIKIDKEVQMLTELKNASLQIAEKCNKITITNETEHAVAVMVFSDANKTLTAIEKKRKELKEPYLEAGRKIDAAAKDIASVLEDAVSKGKKKLLEWTQEQQRKKQIELQRIQGIKDRIIKYKNETMAAIDRCIDTDQLVQVNQTKIAVFPADAEWQEFAADAKEMRKAIHEYAKAKKIALEQPFEREEAHAVMSQIEEEQVIKEEEIASEQIATASLATPSGVRNNWKFEVVDFSKVPDEFKVLDEVKVRAWQKQMREAAGLVDGAVHFGIKHYIEQSVTLR